MNTYCVTPAQQYLTTTSKPYRGVIPSNKITCIVDAYVLTSYMPVQSTIVFLAVRDTSFFGSTNISAPTDCLADDLPAAPLVTASGSRTTLITSGLWLQTAFPDGPDTILPVTAHTDLQTTVTTPRQYIHTVYQTYTTPPLGAVINDWMSAIKNKPGTQFQK